jgi:transposase
MSNVLSDTKREQVVALGRLGWSARRIERETGIRRETASAYLKAAGIGVRPAGRWGHGSAKPAKEVSTDPVASPAKPAKEVSTDSGASAAKPAIEVSTDSGASAAKPAIEVSTDSGAAAVPSPPAPTRSPQASACETHRDFIEMSVRHGRNAMAIFQDLIDDHGFEARYASVRRFVKKLRGSVSPQDGHPFIVTAPGEEAQVDYAGEGPMVRHPETGKYRRTRLFVLTLGYSRKSVRLLVWKSGTREWCELHERAFRRLGGAARVIVLDNLREGVLKPDVYDPALNPLYRDLLKHYGAVALACRVGDPDRKGKVESAVGHAQRTPLKGLRFESIEEAQAYLDRWEERWADTRIHGTTKRQVAAMFAEEKPALLALPLTPFRYYQFGKRTVHLNGCVEVDGAYYGPPPGLIGHDLDVQWDGVHVRLLDPKTGQLLREHDKQLPGLARIRDEDRPTRTPPTTQKLLNRAACAGKSIGVVCQRIHALDGELGIKRILGVLGLAKRHGVQRVEQACVLALEVDVPTYRFVKRYVDKQPDAPLTLRQVDPLIRQLTLYRDLIDRQHQENQDEHD